MLDLLESALRSPAGSFAFVFGLLILAFWLTHWITKEITTIQNSHSNLENENNKTSKKVESYCDKADQHMDEIRKDVSYLKAMMDVFKVNPSQAVAKRNSPVSLTPIGIEISEKINADDMISRNWDAIYKELEENIYDKNAYDIQEYCMETATVELDKFLRKEDIDFIKRYAYKEGRPLAYYAPIFGVIIRDKYLELKGISSDEIDKHDPNISVG